MSNGEFMTDTDVYKFDDYWGELIALSKNKKSNSIVTSISLLFFSALILNPLYINNNFLNWCSTILISIAYIVVLVSICSSSEDGSKKLLLKGIKDDDYSYLLSLVSTNNTFSNKLSKTLISWYLFFMMVAISYIIYTYNILYLQYIFSIVFFLLSFSLFGVIVKHISKVKTNVRDVLNEEGLTIIDLISKVEAYLVLNNN